MTIETEELQAIAKGLAAGESEYSRIDQFGRNLSQWFILRHRDGTAVARSMRGDVIHGGWQETGQEIDLL